MIYIQQSDTDILVLLDNLPQYITFQTSGANKGRSMIDGRI